MKIIKHVLLPFIGLIVVIVLLSITGSYTLAHPGATTSWFQKLQMDKWALSSVRYTVMALLLWYWPSLIRIVAKHKNWPLDVTQSFIALRFHLALFFVVVELLLVHNFFGILLSKIL